MKTCQECKQDKDEIDFHISHHTESKAYTTLKCKDCVRGKPKGFLGKLTPADLASLAANKAEYGTISSAKFWTKCHLSLGKQSFYRYQKLGEVDAVLRTL